MRMRLVLPLAAGLLAVPVLPALAQPAPPNIVQFAHERLEQLHQELQITPAQEGAWDQFARASMNNAAEMQQMFTRRIEQVPQMNAEQNLQSFAELQERQASGFQKVVPAFDRLYDALSPRQKQIADQSFRRMTEAHENRRHGRG